MAASQLHWQMAASSPALFSMPNWVSRLLLRCCCSVFWGGHAPNCFSLYISILYIFQVVQTAETSRGSPYIQTGQPSPPARPPVASWRNSAPPLSPLCRPFLLLVASRGWESVDGPSRRLRPSARWRGSWYDRHSILIFAGGSSENDSLANLCPLGMCIQS